MNLKKRPVSLFCSGGGSDYGNLFRITTFISSITIFLFTLYRLVPPLIIIAALFIVFFGYFRFYINNKIASVAILNLQRKFSNPKSANRFFITLPVFLFAMSESGNVKTTSKYKRSDQHGFSSNENIKPPSKKSKRSFSFADIKNKESYTFSNLLITIPYKAPQKEIPLRQLHNRILKRGLDFIVSLFVIVFFLSWMVPLIGFFIKLESGGSIFFKQLRSGLNNKAFWCYKFRSMHDNESSDKLQATQDDNRVTKIGAFLRKTSLDEFPQFINVLKGEMSIVGPRPHMLKHTEVYGNTVDNYMSRLIIKQGLTGWAQAHGFRGETSDIKLMEKRVHHDLWYLENWNIWLDIKIILLTILQVFKGAY